MRDLVRSEHGRKSPIIRAKAVEIVRYVPAKDHRGRIHAIWEWVKDHVTYIRDIHEVETLHWPTQVLEQMYGDCDDQAMLVAALLESVGIPTRFKAVGFSPGQLSHVYAQARLGSGWIALETTQPVKLGWQPPNIRDTLIIHNWR